MTLLTPLGALAALAVLLPVAAAVVARSRTRAARRTLGLPAPDRRRRFLAPAIAFVGVLLLGLAAAQPALTRTSSSRVSRNAQAVFVVDTSRSMAASKSPGSPTRLDRAVAAAVRLRGAIPQVPSGLLTLTDRVLPDLLPVPDVEGFDGVARGAVRIESPPPRSTSTRATDFGALAGISSGNVFAPSASRRLVVLLTDGESRTASASALARALPAAKGYRFAAVRLWNADESVFDEDGKPEAAYRPDPSGAAALDDLAGSLGGRSFGEGQLGAASSYLRSLAAGGPTVRAGGTKHERLTLAAYVAAAGLVALALSALVSRRLLT
jgi:hypothetical protein